MSLKIWRFLPCKRLSCFMFCRLLIFNKSLSEAFRAEGMVVHINLIAFAILYEPVSLILGLAGNYFSRKQEFQADEFAVKATGKTNLPNALKKLSVDQLSQFAASSCLCIFSLQPSAFNSEAGSYE